MGLGSYSHIFKGKVFVTGYSNADTRNKHQCKFGNNI